MSARKRAFQRTWAEFVSARVSVRSSDDDRDSYGLLERFTGVTVAWLAVAPEMTYSKPYHSQPSNSSVR
ncbi:hypothetical protein EA473_07795 [Natrarchaeobius chitinivorans]|uniref:Uncharacterized protein n=1 Tax=Natrarchaeobius chitinivorans TaxID=1679083 RepID=A0A3N6MIA5_NATCH|nr:hypothetical protein EA473_07795 [Natrarchaeobius chitinivorans]